MTALIVDDEPLARAYLSRLLGEQSVTVLDEAEDAVSALEKTEELKPDLVFLDIQMPGLSGIQMAGALLQLDSPPLVIFVTGYSEHAATAFEQDAVDYIVKPFSAERLSRTLSRSRARIAARDAADGAALPSIASGSLEATALRRLPIREDYSVRLLRLEELAWAESRERRVFVHTTTGGTHKTYYTLTQLEAMLPADRFVRIHDSYLAALDGIEELILLGNHNYEIRLTDDQRLPVGRTRYPDLRRKLGLQGPGTDL